MRGQGPEWGRWAARSIRPWTPGAPRGRTTRTRATWRAASAAASSRQLDDDVRRLDRGDDAHARGQAELVHRLAGQEGNEAAWSGPDPALGRDAIPHHPGHHARQPAARPRFARPTPS